MRLTMGDRKVLVRAFAARYRAGCDGLDEIRALPGVRAVHPLVPKYPAAGAASLLDAVASGAMRCHKDWKHQCDPGQ